MILSSDDTVRPTARYMVIQLPRYKFKEVNKRFWVLMIMLGLYRGIRWSSYRGIEEANKWFWLLSDDTVKDHREIVNIVWYAHLNKEDYLAPIAI